MADNPFASLLNPNAAKAGMWDMRMMSAANRSESPFERGMRSSYGGRGVSGDPMLGQLAGMANEPDYSSFTYNPQMRQQAVNAGVQPLEANQVRRNAILPNNGFFGSHPRLSAAIEGAMFGAAASHGGNTPGESIQGALEGLIGGHRIQQGLYRQQFARPFEAAGMLEGIADQKQKRELQEADIQHLRALNHHLESGDEYKASQLMETNRHNEAVEAMRNTQIEATAPRNLGEGLYGYYSPGGTGPNQKGDWSIQENEQAKFGRSQAGAGPWYTRKDPKTGKTIVGRAHEGAQVPEGASFMQGTYDQKKDDKAASGRESFVKQQLSKPSGAIWMSAGVSPGDKDASERLGKFYDEHIAPNVAPPSSTGRVPTWNPTTGQLE